MKIIANICGPTLYRLPEESIFRSKTLQPINLPEFDPDFIIRENSSPIFQDFTLAVTQI